ncbi:hypothetical protein [Brevibacillus sp. RS1.1]|nr:hypothetical protein [Brevibacillus sp. RS1.1]
MDEKIKKTSHRIVIAGEPQRLTKRASVFYWQKRSIPAVNRRK